MDAPMFARLVESEAFPPTAAPEPIDLPDALM
jgi:hypothetical protein